MPHGCRSLPGWRRTPLPTPGPLEGSGRRSVARALGGRSRVAALPSSPRYCKGSTRRDLRRVSQPLRQHVGPIFLHPIGRIRRPEILQEPRSEGVQVMLPSRTPIVGKAVLKPCRYSRRGEDPSHRPVSACRKDLHRLPCPAVLGIAESLSGWKSSGASGWLDTACRNSW